MPGYLPKIPAWMKGVGFRRSQATASDLALNGDFGRMRNMNTRVSSRREFLGMAGAWLGASALSLAQERDEIRTISIFHTTDLHGHILPTQTYGGRPDVGGFARCATQIREWRRDIPHSLLVDIGDVYQGTPESNGTEGALMMKLFGQLNYDAWVLGNHDFDWGRGILENNLSLSKSPILAANILLEGKAPWGFEGPWKKLAPWVMKEVAGIRIALIGLVTPGLPFWLAPETLAGASVASPRESLLRSIAQAKSAKADAIVVMGHMGWRREDDFANPIKKTLLDSGGVDVFLGGHTHQEKPSWQVGEVLCSQAGYYGIQCGRVDLTFDLQTRKLISKSAFSKLMDHQVAMDSSVFQIADPEILKAKSQQARIIGKAVRTIGGKGRGSELVNLFCECFSEVLKRHQTPVDAVFHGSFGTGDLAAGDITLADCWKMLPYENLLVTAELSANELVKILQEDLKSSSSDCVLWPMSLNLDPAGNIRSLRLHGSEIPSEKRFTVAFNSYDAQSGGQRLMLLREILEKPSSKRKMTGIETRTALIEVITDRKTIG